MTGSVPEGRLSGQRDHAELPGRVKDQKPRERVSERVRSPLSDPVIPKPPEDAEDDGPAGGQDHSRPPGHRWLWKAARGYGPDDASGKQQAKRPQEVEEGTTTGQRNQIANH